MFCITDLQNAPSNLLKFHNSVLGKSAPSLSGSMVSLYYLLIYIHGLIMLTLLIREICLSTMVQKGREIMINRYNYHFLMFQNN